MKHIDRYLSAYIVGCLIGYPESVHTEYVYQTLRESRSKSAHPALQAVLDLVRQGDPKNPSIKKQVRQWIMEQIGGAGGYNAEAPNVGGHSVPAVTYEAYITTQFDVTIISVVDSVQRVVQGLILCAPDEVEKAKDMVREKYKHVQFKNVEQKTQ